MVHAFRTSLSLAFAFAGFAACMASSRAQSLYTFAFPTNPPVVPVLQFDGTTRPAGSSPTFNRPVPNGASAPTLLSGLLTGYSAKTFVIPFADSYDCLCESGNPTDWAGGFFIYSGALDAPNPLTNCLAGDIGSDGTGHSVLRGLPLSPGTYTFVTTSAASGVFGSYAATVAPSPDSSAVTPLASGSTAPTSAGSPTYNAPKPNGANPPVSLSSLATAARYDATPFDIATDALYEIRSAAQSPVGTTTSWNNEVAVYSGSFDPNAPLSNCVAAVSSLGTGLADLPSLPLPPGHYILVTSGADNNSVGAFSNLVKATSTTGIPVFATTGSTQPTGASPTFRRPTPNGVNPPTGVSSASYFYGVRSFTAPTSGPYNFLVTCPTTGSATGWLPTVFVYANAFDPAQPLSNCLRGASAPVKTSVGFTASLTAGTTYYLVVSSNAVGTFGAYSALVAPVATSGAIINRPTFNRPDSAYPAAPATLSVVGTDVAYDTYTYSPTVSEPVTFAVTTSNNIGWSPCLFLYDTNFDPNNPLSDCVAGRYFDIFSASMTYNVTAGKTYTVVMCGYSNANLRANVGDYALTVSGAAGSPPALAFSDTLTGGTGTQFKRPLANGVSAPTKLSSNSTYYHADSFTVPKSGSYNITAACTPSAQWNISAALYHDSFSAASPLTNPMIAVDSLGNPAVAMNNVTLNAGTTYTLVTTGFGYADFGGYSISVGPSLTQPTIASYSGVTTLGDGPHFVRPNPNGILPPMTLSAALSDYYEADVFTVPADGLYSLTATVIGTPTWNIFAALYQSSFDPARPLTNCLAAVGGANGAVTISPLPLKAGVTYTMVTTGIANTDSGAYALSLSAYAPALLSVRDALTPGFGPNFIRPVENGILPPTIPAPGAGYYYQDQAFTVPATGIYNISSTAATPFSFGPFFVLYQNSFDPMQPLNNALLAAGSGLLSPTQDDFALVTAIPLTAGVAYHLVTTADNSVNYGEFHNTVYTSGIYPVIVPDNYAPGLSATLTIGDSFPIGSLNSVTLRGLHYAWCGDLVATLTHNGVTAELFDRIGRLTNADTDFGANAAFDADTNGKDFTFAPGGADISQFGSLREIPDTQPYAPYLNGTPGQSANFTATFADFAGMDAAGDWTLTISDRVSKFRATWKGFTLNFTPAVITTVSGTLTLDGIASGAPAQPFTFTFRPVGGGPDIVKAAPVGPQGTYTLSGLPKQAYHVLIQGGSYLAVKLFVDASAGTVRNANALLRPGDANNDDSCDVLDFGILVNAYGSLQSDPASDYDPTADFNLDGAVNVLDFGLLVNNYGGVGDTL